MPGQCTYCGTRLRRGRLSASGYSMDHLIPRSILKRSNVTLTPQQRTANKLPCCIACNGKKDQMNPLDWIANLNDPKRRAIVMAILETLPYREIYHV